MSSSNDWKQMFRFTKDGKLQSLTFMYAFFLGIAVLFLNFLISNQTSLLFESWFRGLSRSALNLLDTIVPTVLCAAIVLPVFLLIRKKQIVLLGYWFAFLIALIFFLAACFLYDSDVRDILLAPFFCIFVVPAIAEAIVVTFLFVMWRKKNPDPIGEEQKELYGKETDSEDSHPQSK